MGCCVPRRDPCGCFECKMYILMKTERERGKYSSSSSVHHIKTSPKKEVLYIKKSAFLCTGRTVGGSSIHIRICMYGYAPEEILMDGRQGKQYHTKGKTFFSFSMSFLLLFSYAIRI